MHIILDDLKVIEAEVTLVGLPIVEGVANRKDRYGRELVKNPKVHEIDHSIGTQDAKRVLNLELVQELLLMQQVPG